MTASSRFGPEPPRTCPDACEVLWWSSWQSLSLAIHELFRVPSCFHGSDGLMSEQCAQTETSKGFCSTRNYEPLDGVGLQLKKWSWFGFNMLSRDVCLLNRTCAVWTHRIFRAVHWRHKRATASIGILQPRLWVANRFCVDFVISWAFCHCINPEHKVTAGQFSGHTALKQLVIPCWLRCWLCCSAFARWKFSAFPVPNSMVFIF